MKICMFAKGLPVHIKGGMEIYVEELAKGLVKRGHEVTIITTKHPEGRKKEEEEGNLRIYYVGDKPLKYTRTFFKESIKLFKNLNEKNKFDIVHSQSGAGVAYALKCKKTAPLVITFQGTALTEAKSLWNEGRFVKKAISVSILFRDFIHYFIFSHKYFYIRADKIIAVSNELKEVIKMQYKVPEEKLVVIPNGIDINKFKPINVEDLRRELSLGGKKAILSVGAVHRQKGFHLLLNILPEILKEEKDVKLVIVGSGPYLENLKNIALKLGVSKNVLFIGSVSHEKLVKYYNLANIFAFPTLRYEGLPLVVPEAMACEKPVITSRIGGIPTAIENGKDGFLIEPGNLKELRERILEVLGDEELARKLGENARKKVLERFSLDRMVEDTIKVYDAVTSGR